MKRNQPILILVTALAIAAMACNLPVAQPSADATEVSTEEPTEVSTEEPEVAQTEVPTEEVPNGVRVSVSTATNCRTGPDVAYQLLMTVQPGTDFEVVGKYTPKTYWIINMPTGGTCWLWGQYATVIGDTSVLPEIAAPAPPPVAQADPNQNENSNDNDSNNNDSENSNDSGNGNDNSNNNPTIPLIPIIPAFIVPSPPSNVNVTKTCDFNFPNTTQTSTITWGDTSSETGYVIYKDGVAIANLGANVTKYVDKFNVLFGANTQVKYGVQTVIGSSKSAPAEQTIDVCN